MRFLLISLLISSPLLAQVDTGNGSSGACTRATIANGGTFNCTTLDISGAPFSFNPGAQAAVIKVQGNVSITTSISVEGGIGPSDLDVNGPTVAGGAAGPGATRGGGVLSGSFSAQDGEDHLSPTNSYGRAGIAGVCGSGGGGGSFASLGLDGNPCSAAGGEGGANIFSSMPTLLGGLGGASGGEGLATRYGAGGGGGGVLIISAGGNILINGNISARGGMGGNCTSDGGGGGGGSGGIIVITSLGQITNNGTMSANGGPGGVSVSGGDGGTG